MITVLSDQYGIQQPASEITKLWSLIMYMNISITDLVSFHRLQQGEFQQGVNFVAQAVSNC